MDGAGIQEMLTSPVAIIVYEAVVLAVLLFLDIGLARKRKQRKMQQEQMRMQQENEMLDKALTNQKRG